MPQISRQEYERLPLRVHDFLARVPLHDVWAIDLPRARSGITLDEFLGKSSACTCTPPPLVRGLLNIRLLVGRLLGWIASRLQLPGHPSQRASQLSIARDRLRQRANARDFSGWYTASRTSSSLN